MDTIVSWKGAMDNKPENKNERLEWPHAKRFLIFCVALTLGFYCFLAVYDTLTVPFLLSLFFSYLLAPFVDYLDRRYRIPRIVFVTAVLVFTVGLISLAVMWVIPYVYHEILFLVKLAPSVLDTINQSWYPAIKEYLLGFEFVSEKLFNDVFLEWGRVDQWTERVQRALTTIWNSAPQVVGTVVNIVMTPLLTFFFVKDEKRILGALRTLVPVDLRQPTRDILGKIGKTFHSVIKGQITVASILAVLYVVGFSIAGLRAGVAIGLVAGVCRLVPYLDVVVGGILSLIVVLADWQGPGQLFFVVGVFAVVQALDGMLITPRVIGERLGIHPMIVIATILAFADLWGFWGVLLAIPTIAIVKVIFLTVIPYYQASKAYRPRV